MKGKNVCYICKKTVPSSEVAVHNNRAACLRHPGVVKWDKEETAKCKSQN